MDEKTQNRFRFTKAKIDSLTTVEGRRQSWFHDKQTRGLCLCVSKTGTKTFYALRKFKGRTERIKLGRYPETTIWQARQRAGETSSKFDAGLNVGEIKRQERGELNLGALFEEYMVRHAKVYNRQWQQSAELFDLHLAKWKTRRLSTISKQEIARWHAKIGSMNGKYTANNALTLLRAVFNRAIEWELFVGPNPTNGTKKFRTKSRERYLLPDEMERFMCALENDPDRSFRDVIKLLLFTGARKANVLAMRWVDLNLDTGLWHIPMTKNGESQQLPLSSQAAAVLRERAERMATQSGDVVQLPQKNKLFPVGNHGSTLVRFSRDPTMGRKCYVLDSEFVFPGTGRTGHLADPRKPWKRLLKRAEIADFRVHDLRRTHGSYMAATGASLTIIGKALGHKDIQSTQIYARLDTDPVRHAVESATVAMLNSGKRTGPAAPNHSNDA